MSSLIVIKANCEVIGAAQGYTIDNSTGKGEIHRLRIDRAKLKEAFNSDKFLANHQIRPLTIVYIQSNGEDSQTDVLENVWIMPPHYTYQTDDWIIADWVAFDADSKPNQEVI